MIIIVLDLNDTIRHFITRLLLRDGREKVRKDKELDSCECNCINGFSFLNWLDNKLFINRDVR
jgi:hypothetical protein